MRTTRPAPSTASLHRTAQTTRTPTTRSSRATGPATAMTTKTATRTSCRPRTSSPAWRPCNRRASSWRPSPCSPRYGSRTRPPRRRRSWTSFSRVGWSTSMGSPSCVGPCHRLNCRYSPRLNFPCYNNSLSRRRRRARKDPVLHPASGVLLSRVFLSWAARGTPALLHRPLPCAGAVRLRSRGTPTRSGKRSDGPRKRRTACSPSTAAYRSSSARKAASGHRSAGPPRRRAGASGPCRALGTPGLRVSRRRTPSTPTSCSVTKTGWQRADTHCAASPRCPSPRAMLAPHFRGSSPRLTLLSSHLRRARSELRLSYRQWRSAA